MTTAYVPTRIPIGYRYSRWQKVNDSLVLTFKERTSADTFRFEVSKLAPAAPCDGGGAFHRIIQTDGNKIYYGGDKGYWKAWRCVVFPRRQRCTTPSRPSPTANSRTSPSHRSPLPASASPSPRRKARRSGPSPLGTWSRLVLWAADEAEAIFVGVARSEEVQSVDHVVVAAHNGSIDPRPLNYVKLPGSVQEVADPPSATKGKSLSKSNRIANEPPGMW